MRRSWPPAGPAPGPARPGKAARCARASCPAAAAGVPSRSATRTGIRATNAPIPAPTTSPPRCALRAAVEPAQVTLALAAAGEVTIRRQRSVRAAELAVERARYDADRAERALLACEPENRLVARTLEARWETRLTGLAGAEAALATQRSAQPELPSPDQLAATIADLPALWSAPATSDKDRKRLLRALLADVTIT